MSGAPSAPSHAVRLGLVILALALGAWCAKTWVWPKVSAMRGGPLPLTIVDAPPEDVGFAVWRERVEAQYPPIPIRAFQETTLKREVLAQPLLRKLFPVLGTPEMVWHPQLHFQRPRGLERRVVWPEHPAGEWWLRTNAAGFRMDDELAPEGPYFLIAGDSHVEGACSNDESVAGLVSAALAGAEPTDEEPQQVVTAACGGYSFHQYLGSLEALDGDVPGQLVDLSKPPAVRTMAVVVYGGNDFQEVLKLAHYWARTDRPKGWGLDNERLAKWRQSELPVIGQGLESVLYFRRAPSEIELALSEALAVSEELQRHATLRGIRLVFLYLPSAMESEPERHRERLDPLLKDLAVTSEDLSLTFALGDRYLEGLQALGCDVLDLRPALREGGPYFWNLDLHLNLEGQRLVAARLLDWYRSPAR